LIFHFTFSSDSCSNGKYHGILIIACYEEKQNNKTPPCNTPTFYGHCFSRSIFQMRFLELIKSARRRAYSLVNTELVDLYWQVGSYISRSSKRRLGRRDCRGARKVYSETSSQSSGFYSRQPFQDAQFYETYCHDRKVAALLRPIALDPPPFDSWPLQTPRRT